MPKALCWVGIVVAILVFALFFLDLVLAFVSTSLAPFRGRSMMLSIVFVICALGLAYCSWTTLRAQD